MKKGSPSGSASKMPEQRDSVNLLICIFITFFVSCISCSSEMDSASPDANSTNILTKSAFIDPRFTLECHRREYTFKAARYDESGRKCWQFVTIMSCWGRCDSGEIADWRFPFKKSYHPICGHDRKRMRKIRLKHCDPGVDENLRNYKITEAVTCSCRVCHSALASCEGLPHISTRSV